MYFFKKKVVQLREKSDLRKDLVTKIWDKVEMDLKFKTLSKKDKNMHKQILAALDKPMYQMAKKAIITKYTTIMKMAYIDQVMIWRSKILKLRLEREETQFLKVKLAARRVVEAMTDTKDHERKTDDLKLI
jgi:hypothetical protein